MNALHIKKYCFLLSVSICVAGVFVSCSTKKNTLTRRFYHNLTAHYNVFFNAKEAYKAGYKSIETSHKDNYSEIIPMFVYSDKAACASGAGSMDKCITKSKKLIKEHSITARPKPAPSGVPLSDKQKAFYIKKDYCNWVKDAYMLMGKANLMKHDFFNAAKNFTYLSIEYKNTDLKIPSLLWLAESRTEEGSPEDAIETLDKISEDPKYKEPYHQQHAAFVSNALITKKKYDDAIPKLIETISLTKKRKDKLRYMYILAQLYQTTKDMQKAQETYTKLLTMNPSYEMEFNAKISLATSFESGNTTEIKKMLNKLLREGKNKEFQDQIYFALANLSMKEGDMDKALEYYKLSIAKSTTNNNQKALSMRAIADIYYDKKNYLKAQPYYDSCVTLLDEKARDYAALKIKAANLNDLIKNYTIVITEDSLERMAQMSPSERNAAIDKAIAEVTRQEELEKQREREAAANAASFVPTISASGQKTASNWFFYNTNLVSQGKVDFVKLWGSRTLEDDWRRKNKAATHQAEETESTDAAADSLAAKKAKMSKKSRDYYMIDVPLTDSAMAVSKEKKELAQYTVASIFMNKIQDNPAAIEAFETFVKVYPNSNMLITVYYNLYILYQTIGNNAKAEQYKQLVISGFPNSKYAQAITNPNFFRDSRARATKIETIYKTAYKAYFQGNFTETIEAVAQAEKEYPDCSTMPKFQFLKTMCKGRMGSTDTLQSELTRFVAKYPKDETTPLAKQILEFIKTKKQEGLGVNAPLSALMHDSTLSNMVLAASPEQKKEEQIYVASENEPHIYAIVADAKAVSLNRLKFNAMNYNLEYFSNFNFEIIEHPLNKHFNMLIIKPFTDSKQGMSYYDLATISDELFEGVDKTKIDQFVISNKNYEMLLKDMRIDKYMDYFFENYVK